MCVCVCVFVKKMLINQFVYNQNNLFYSVYIINKEKNILTDIWQKIYSQEFKRSLFYFALTGFC